jgi:hypothetical protein
LEALRQVFDLAKLVANLPANFAEAPLLVNVAEAEAKCD